MNPRTGEMIPTYTRRQREIRGRLYYHRGMNITIEIAPRGSGKTHRMIEDAIRFLVYDDIRRVCFVTSNHREKEYIRRIFNEWVRNHHLDWNLTRRAICYSAREGGDVYQNLFGFSNARGQDNRVYFDNFEQMDMGRDRLPIFKNAYYTSSPRTRFEDSECNRIMNIVSDVDGGDWHESSFPLSRHYDYEEVVNNNWDVGFRTEYGIGMWGDPEQIVTLRTEIIEESKADEDDEYLYRLGCVEIEYEEDSDSVPF